MAAVAGHLDLKLDWPEETGWPNLPTSLETGRVDVACSSYGMTLFVENMAYTQPLFIQHSIFMSVMEIRDFPAIWKKSIHRKFGLLFKMGILVIFWQNNIFRKPNLSP